MSDFAKRLKKLRENWKESMENIGGMNDAWDDGRYKFQLQSAEIVDAESSGKMMIAIEHYCTEGEMAGEVYREYLQLETKWGPFFVMQRIQQLGREVPENPEDIEEVIAEIAEANPIYEATIKTNKDDYKNLKVVKLLEGETESEEEEELKLKKKKRGRPKKEEKEDDEEEEDEEKEDEEEEEDEEEYEVGDKVKFKLGRKKVEGIVKSVNNEDEELKIKVGRKNEVVEFSKVIEKIEEEEEYDEENDDEEEEEEDLKSELIAFCEAQDIEIKSNFTEKKLIKEINNYECEKVDLVKSEIALLKKIGGTVI